MPAGFGGAGLAEGRCFSPLPDEQPPESSELYRGNTPACFLLVFGVVFLCLRGSGAGLAEARCFSPLAHGRPPESSVCKDKTPGNFFFRSWAWFCFACGAVARAWRAFLWDTYKEQLLIASALADVSVGRLQGAATANFLADVSVGRLQGAATANSLSGIFWGRLQGAATAPVLAGVSVGRLQGAATANFLADVSVSR